MKKNTELLSAMNRSEIIRFLERNGPCSRADLSRELGLSFPAISSNVKCLMESGLVYEGGEGNNALGRKSTLLTFNANWAHLVGVDIGRRHIRTMCADASGREKSFYCVKYDPKDVYDVVVSAVEAAVQQAGVPMDEVACIGVGLPGIYNEKTNVHMLAPFMEGWNAVDLFPRLKEHYADQTISVENSVNLGAVGEWSQGCAQGCANVVYMEYGVGFGAAILQNGKILHGANGAAGEIAYMTVESSALRDHFASAGSLEQVIPSQRISALIARQGQDNLVDMDQVLEKLTEELLPEQVARIPKYFAMSIINTIAVVNPELLVISGRLGIAMFRRFEREILDLINAHIPFPPKLCCSTLNEKANVIGAIAMAKRLVEDTYKNFPTN